MKILLRIFYIWYGFVITCDAQKQSPPSILDSSLCVNKLCECTFIKNKYNIQCENVDENVMKGLANVTNFQKDGIYLALDTLRLIGIRVNALNITFANSSLGALNLSKNRFTKIENEVFKNLQYMKSLDLSFNQLKVIDPDVFKGMRLDGADYPLKSLTVIRLSHNDIHSLNADIFQHIDRRLEYLYLDNNPLQVIDNPTLQAINSLVYLKFLDLSNTGIKTLASNFMHTPAHLEVLILANNQIDNILQLGLEQSKALVSLDLSGNPNENITSENGFPMISTLVNLSLCNMPKLVEIGKHSLSNLPKLEILYIENNPNLMKIDDDALISTEPTALVPPLKKLYIRNNKLMHLQLTLNWKYLTDLDLRGNPWICECDNQWFLDDLISIYLSINETQAKELRCAAPVEMENRYLYQLWNETVTMRCLDFYGNRPERDAAMLVGFLLGILLVLPISAFLVFAYKKRWFARLSDSYTKWYHYRRAAKYEDELF